MLDDAVRRDAVGDDDRTHRIGTPLRQAEVVLGRAREVGIPADLDLRHAVLLGVGSGLVDDLAPFGGQVRLVELEVDGEARRCGCSSCISNSTRAARSSCLLYTSPSPR